MPGLMSPIGTFLGEPGPVGSIHSSGSPDDEGPLRVRRKREGVPSPSRMGADASHGLR